MWKAMDIPPLYCCFCTFGSWTSCIATLCCKSLILLLYSYCVKLMTLILILILSVNRVNQINYSLRFFENFSPSEYEFNPNFTRLLHVHIYAELLNLTHLSLAVTKLCHIVLMKCCRWYHRRQDT